jgi:hypothetical protein
MKRKSSSDKLSNSVASAFLGQEGEGLDYVVSLLKRRANGKQLSETEESLVADAEAAMTGLLREPSGYRPDSKKEIQPPEAAPLPYSSFAEGLVRLQAKIRKSGSFPKLRKTGKTGAYRPDIEKATVSFPVTEAKIYAIVKMARMERAQAERKTMPAASVRRLKSR